MADDNVRDIRVRSAITAEGKGFCVVVVESGGGRLLLGQLSPEEVRQMALMWLAAAEAAEQDAAALRVLRRLGIGGDGDELARELIGELRAGRDMAEGVGGGA